MVKAEESRMVVKEGMQHNHDKQQQQYSFLNKTEAEATQAVLSLVFAEGNHFLSYIS